MKSITIPKMEGQTRSRYLSVCGAINLDINLFVERFAEIGEEVPVERLETTPGGKGANTAVAAARVLDSKSGFRVSLIGGLGRDRISQQQVKILKRENVVTSTILRLKGAKSGRAYIIIDKNGRKTIQTLFGANQELKPPHITNNYQISNVISNSMGVVVIDPPLEVTGRIIGKASSQRGTWVIWSPGVYCTEGLHRLCEILQVTDYLIVNSIELFNISGERVPKHAYTKISKLLPKLKLIVTEGSGGCEMYSPDSLNPISIPGVDVSKFGLKVVNTVGCGDAFLGVFAASKLESFSDEMSLRRANLAAALKATKYETRGSPMRYELENRLEEYQDLLKVK
jgi:ribokinase